VPAVTTHQLDYAHLLGEAMRWGVSTDRYRQLSPAAARCLNDCECNTTNRVSMWCAQVGHESLGLCYMEEIADGSAYEGREDLGNIYPGDGCKFKGRGPIMVTGRDNYTRCSQWAFEQGLVPSAEFFVDQPEEMASDYYGFIGTTWYWTTQRPMNDAADAGDIELATYYVNGGYNGLEDRTERWHYCLGMGEAILGLTDEEAAAMAAPPLVGEKVLNYDHSIVPQETGYWCGPASAQVCLNIRGIHVPEAQLAAECGTDEGGTDYVALIENCLDPRLPEAHYTSVDAPNDPPTQQQKDRLWDGILRSINNGYGIVMNWVAPVSNYPVGIKGSTSPSYGGGTVFHYVTCAGYDDNPSQRAVWIADSGFQPFGYWMSFEQCATLIPPKALCYADLPHAATAPPALDYVRLDYEQKCGPIDPATGSGTGWPQLGQNELGQNLWLVDALSEVLHLLEQGKARPHARKTAGKPKTAPDYALLNYEQSAGPITADGLGRGWAQLGGRSITDAVAHIKNTLSGGAPPPVEQPPVQPPSGNGASHGPVALLTFAGTWAPPGVGFPSDVAHACTDVAEEIPVQAPWSFGKPVSYAESVTIGVDWAVDWTLTHADRPVIAGGYSQGGEAASRYRMEFEPGGRLAHLRANFRAGYIFGNPSRHLEKTFFDGPPTDGEGIAQFRLPLLGDEWCELVDTYDMYAGVPATLTGEIMRDVYTLCTELEAGGGLEETFVANCLALLGNLDGDAYDDMQRGVARHGVDISHATLLPNEQITPLSNRYISVAGIAAAIQACILGIQFVCWQPPTAPHIEYHIREVWPGQTYVGLAIQHVHHWATVHA
jgi:predicted chitinase